MSVSAVFLSRLINYQSSLSSPQAQWARPSPNASPPPVSQSSPHSPTATLSDIARRARWVLSILPPSDALGFAQEFRSVYTDLPDGERERAGSGKIAFVECNAVNLETAKKIGAVFQGTPITFVDAAIIGFPPRPQDGYDPKLYASVDPKDDDTLKQFEELGRYGLKVCPLRGEGVGVGDASALKMSYGGIVKGVIGLYATMILAAHTSSPATATALTHELASSQPFFLKHITSSIPDMLPKAYRFVGEMEEISRFVGGEERLIHEGMARLYERVSGSVEEGGEDVAVLAGFAEEAR
ncbi:hypothetical protein EIP91_010513, partial [Steccherinum ochraceum]